jgi:hypothetical protein
LDKQLLDYEKIRADFEIFNLQKGGAADDLTKYLKTEKQAQLISTYISQVMRTIRPRVSCTLEQRGRGCKMPSRVS